MSQTKIADLLRTPFASASPLVVAGVVAELVTLASERGPDVAAIVVDAYMGDRAEGAFRVFIDAAEFGCGVDEAHAWLWVSAASGNVEAARRLAVAARSKAVFDRHADRVRGPVPKQHKPRRSSPGAESSFLTAADVEAGEPDVDEPHAPPAEETVAAKRPVHPEAKVVLPFVGDADSKDGKELVRRFGSVVGVPLPPRGQVPAPGVMYSEIVRRWPWAADAARQVEGSLAVLRRSGSSVVRLSPLLFVGTSGCGKSTLARFVCERLGLHTVPLPCGGSNDAAGVASVTRGWSTARPGAFAMAVLNGGVSNPAFVLDEIEKSPPVGSQNGSVQGILLSAVGERDPGAFQDSCLLGPVDVTSMTFLATANSLGPIDPALRDRFLVVRVGEPRDEDFEVILANCRKDFGRSNGIPDRDLPVLSRNAVDMLRKFLSTYRSARKLSDVYGVMVKHSLIEEENAPPPTMLN